MRKTIVSAGYGLVFGAAAIASLAFFLMAAAPVSFGTLMTAFIVSLFIGAFYPGSKTSLQLFFLSIGAMVLISTLHFSWGWGGWGGVALCAFMVWSMKLDGGDGDGG